MLRKRTLAIISLLFLFLCINAQEKLENRNNHSTSTNECVCESYFKVCCPDNCVPYYLCNNNGSVNSDGTNIFDIRSLSPTAKFEPSRKHFTSLFNKTIDLPAISLNDNRTGCGHRNPDGLSMRIFRYEENIAEYGEFPWMVVLLREEKIEENSNPVSVYQCGGALIHPQVVVTTAYCVQSDQQFIARAGTWNTQNIGSEMFPHQEREVGSIIIHPQYKSGPLHNDIALLFLKKPFQIRENVNVVCLPPQGIAVDKGRCFASGYGKDQYGTSGNYSELPKKVELPILPRDSCQEALRKVRVGENFVLHESFVCAGGEEGKDTCLGDGGSPLVCPIPGEKERYQQVGIVSWGIKCGEKDIPGVYVNLALFRNWIDQQMELKNFDKSTYHY